MVRHLVDVFVVRLNYGSWYRRTMKSIYSLNHGFELTVALYFPHSHERKTVNIYAETGLLL